MSYPEFKECIMECLQRLLPCDVDIRLIEIEKNNGCLRSGVVFKKENAYFSPTIYLESFYNAFFKGDDLEDLAKEIIRCYQQDTLEIPENFWDISDFCVAKHSIYAKLIHFAKNKQFLEDKPYQKFLDLAVIVYFEMEGKDGFQGNVIITNSLLHIWNVSEEELFQLAFQNTKEKKSFLFRSMMEVLDDYFSEEERLHYEQAQQKMYVLTNKNKHYGAITVCYMECLKGIRDVLGVDYYLIPASVHEWIVLPNNGTCDVDYLKYLVKSMNDTVISPEEVLSDAIYMYHLETQNIEIL